MQMDRMEKMLREFTGTDGVSGAEGEVFALMERHLEGIVEVSRDRLGSFIGRLAGGEESPRIMLAAHMDETGFMVSGFSGSFVRFNTLGGWWRPRLLGMTVRIIASEGPVEGVIAAGSPFHMEKDEREKVPQVKDMYIDVGLSGKKKPADIGIKPGDPVVPVSPFTVLAGGETYMAKAWDDRAGCVVVVEAMKRLARSKAPGTVYAVGTVQEEVGIRGAMTSGHSVRPDVCLAIDVNIAQDLPGSADEAPEKLGAGVSICVYDATLIPNRKLRDLVAGIAERKGIPCHFSAVPFGGTDGGRVHLNEAGVPTLVLGLPTRHIHSASGIIHRKDIDSAIELVAETVASLDAKTVESLS